MRVAIILTTIIAGILSVGTLCGQDSFKLTPVDIPPLFEGCDDPLVSEEQRQACSVPKIQKFVHQNITYPDSARAHQIEGVVVVRFSVTEKGKITSLELIRDIGGGCGDEAMRVVRMMPDFRPALRDGKPVATKMTLPIRFTKKDLENANKTTSYQVHWGTVYEDEITQDQLKELLKHYLVVRDHFGNTYDIKYLNLQIMTKNKIIEANSKGNILSKEMLRALKRVRANQKLIFEATIQKKYEEIEVVREIIVVK